MTAAPSPHRFFSPPGGARRLFLWFPVRWVLHFVFYLIGGVALHESPSCSREDSLDDCGRPCDPLTCLLFSALWLRCSQSFLGNPVSKGSRSHMFHDVHVQRCHTPTSRTYVLGLACQSFLAAPILSDLRFLLMFPAVNNNEVPFQLLYALAGDRVLLKHNRRYSNVLQVGIDVALSFPKACVVLLGTP